MNYILKLFVMVALALVLAGTAHAKRDHGMLERLDEQLELSDQQRDQIAALLEAHRELIGQQRDRQADRTDWRQQRREARLALRGEIRELLTDEQARRYDQMKHRKGRRHRSNDS